MNILKIDKIPYVLTLLFVLSTWCITKVTDNLLGSTILEYECKVQSGKVYYMITNLSNTILNNITIKLTGTGIKDPTIITYPPAWKEGVNWEPDEENFEFALYNIEQMQPNWQYVISAAYEGDQTPEMYFVSKDKQTIYYREAGVMTWLVKKQNTIIISMLALWISAIIIYFIALSRGKKQAE